MRLMRRTVCTCSVEGLGVGTMEIDCWCKAGRPAALLIEVKTLEERTTVVWSQEVSGGQSGAVEPSLRTCSSCKNQASERADRPLVSGGLAHKAQDLMV